MTKHKAKLIVLEGIDGTSKTTTANKLKEHYEQQGKKVKLYHEPYQYGSIDIKKILEGQNTDLSVLLLMMAVRDNSVKFILEPALKEYDVVIADRYYYSTYAYQYKAFTPLIEKFYYESSLNYPKPDKIFLFAIKDLATYSNNKDDIFEKQSKIIYTYIQTRYLDILSLNLRSNGIAKLIKVNQQEQPYFDFQEVLEALGGI